MENKLLIEKLKKERKELVDKIHKLQIFIDSLEFKIDLSIEHQFLLKMQNNVMCEYCQILVRRIELLEKGNKENE